MYYTIDQELGLTRFSKDENLFSPFGLEAPSENHQRMTETSSADALNLHIYQWGVVNYCCLVFRGFPVPRHEFDPNHDNLFSAALSSSSQRDR